MSPGRPGSRPSRERRCSPAPPRRADARGPAPGPARRPDPGAGLRGPDVAGFGQVELGDGGFAHLELLDLPGDRHRELGGEPDVARDLVVRDLALAVLPDRGGVKLRAGPQPYPGAQLLAVLQVGNADDLDLLDGRMAVEELLDLARVDVLAAPDHQVLDPAYDVEV